MKKLLRYIFGAILLLAGIGIVIFCVYFTIANRHVSPINISVPLGLGGLMLALSGWSLITGERIRDVLSFLFIGLWP